MRRVILALVLGALAAAGCQSTPTSPALPTVKHMKVNDVELAYVDQGSGVTVLFVHGAGGDWRTWDVMRGYVSPRYRFVSVSRRYHFPNSWADEGRYYTFDQQVEDIAAFIRAMNVGKVHLVGNSYGGRLVGYVALRHPELLRSVVLGEPSLASPSSSEGRSAASRFSRDIGLAGAAAKAGDDRQATILTVNAVLDDPVAFEKLSPSLQQRWLDNAKTMGPMFSGRPPAPVTCDQLKGLKVPALAIRGERTRDSYRFGHEALMACLPPSAQAAVVPAGTHFWAIDSPDAAAAAIVSFISKY
jgi:pimeloyl-ACP methyl ester carboxylesterase